jgi:hypothetical protein
MTVREQKKPPGKQSGRAERWIGAREGSKRGGEHKTPPGS